MKSNDPAAARLPDILRCPVTKAALELNEDGTAVRVVGDELAYPVRNGIPVLVPGAARPSGEFRATQA
ncbi:MAG: hypothetical protein RIB58_13390 [Phycisphaerales bacterium]